MKRYCGGSETSPHLFQSHLSSLTDLLLIVGDVRGNGLYLPPTPLLSPPLRAQLSVLSQCSESVPGPAKPLTPPRIPSLGFLARDVPTLQLLDNIGDKQQSLRSQGGGGAEVLYEPSRSGKRRCMASANAFIAARPPPLVLESFPKPQHWCAIAESPCAHLDSPFFPLSTLPSTWLPDSEGLAQESGGMALWPSMMMSPVESEMMEQVEMSQETTLSSQESAWANQSDTSYFDFPSEVMPLNPSFTPTAELSDEAAVLRGTGEISPEILMSMMEAELNAIKQKYAPFCQPSTMNPKELHTPLVRPISTSKPPSMMMTTMAPLPTPALDPIQPTGILPARNTKKRSKKCTERIPRPPNPFILYRADHQGEVSRANLALSVQDISRRLGAMWRSASREIKQRYRKLADEKKREHSVNYPGYKYRPNPPRKSRNRRKEGRTVTEQVERRVSVDEGSELEGLRVYDFTMFNVMEEREALWGEEEVEGALVEDGVIPVLML